MRAGAPAAKPRMVRREIWFSTLVLPFSRGADFFGAVSENFRNLKLSSLGIRSGLGLSRSTPIRCPKCDVHAHTGSPFLPGRSPKVSQRSGVDRSRIGADDNGSAHVLVRPSGCRTASAESPATHHPGGPSKAWLASSRTDGHR